MTQANATTDIDTLKTRLKATWRGGNYDYFSRFRESSAVELLDRLDIPAGLSLLDVACGSGQLGLIAARRGIKVTGVDIATNSILAARSRANAEGLDARLTRETRRPFHAEDPSTWWRVCRRDVRSTPGTVWRPASAGMSPGGTIAWATGPQKASAGRCFKTFARLSRRRECRAGAWEMSAPSRSRFGSGVSASAMSRVTYRFDYPFGRQTWWEFFRDKLRPRLPARAARSARPNRSSASRGAFVISGPSHNPRPPQSHHQSILNISMSSASVHEDSTEREDERRKTS